MESEKRNFIEILSAIARNSFLPVFVFAVVGVYALNNTGNDNKPVSEPPAGKVIYENKCGKCHTLFAPDKYNAKQWRKWVDKMAPKAKLNSNQTEQVYQYLSTTTKKK